MSQRLRDLVKQVRACKTAAEERTVITKECAAIRSSFNDDAGNRHRNVAKLLYIQMLGYPTAFGQMECLKLIVSPHYSDKRIGYLGLMLLLDENSEVLTLVTNSLQNDLGNLNQFIVGLALCAVGNISSVGIAQDCASDIEKLLGSTNPFIIKKAILAAIRIIRKCPQLSETFLAKISALMTEKNHGVLLTTLTLILELCQDHPEYIENFRELTSMLVSTMKNLVQSAYSPEYDVNGVTDPFLQVKILRVLRLLGTKNTQSSELMHDILAQVATNTECSRNVGNAILYECVLTIMGIEAEPGLRVLAVNILGKFLLNKDNNIRYVALNTLNKSVEANMVAVQRHRNTIVDCLRDPDISIRRRALDLIYTLVNESNVRILVRELLNFLVVSDIQFKPDVVAKICWVTEKYAPSKRWHFDTILRVLSVAGNFVPEEVPASLIRIIAATPELQRYATQKLFTVLSRDLSQTSMQQIGFWCMGEYGDLLISDVAETDPDEEPLVKCEPTQVLDLFENILRLPQLNQIVIQYAVNAAMKLSSRFPQQYLQRIKAVIDNYSSNINFELQQRACEYSNLFNWTKVRNNVAERIPPLEDDFENQNQQQKVVPKTEILELIDLSSSKPLKTKIDTPIQPPTPKNVITELFGPSGVPNLIPITPIPIPTPGPVAVPYGTGSSTFTVFQKNGMLASFSVAHPPNQPHLYNVTATFRNSTATPFVDFLLKAAVPKYLKLQLKTASDTVLPPNNSLPVTQIIQLINTQHEQQSPVIMKLRFEYRCNNSPVIENVDVTFPPGV